MKECWIDVRSADAVRDALCEESVHLGLHAVVAADPAHLAPLPPTIRRVLLCTDGPLPDDIGVADLVVVDHRMRAAAVGLRERCPDRRFGTYVEVVDRDTLREACDAVRREEVTVLWFRDPTNIPLEIVLAAAADADGLIVTVVGDVDEAKVHTGVLEHGPGGVMLAPSAPGEAGRLRDAVGEQSPDLPLVVLTVSGVTHAGMGERACVDTCTYLRKDEGILVGSRAKGMVLCVSETHPLPYMPTRPFRVNAGAIMSYTLTDHRRTHYLSELGAGSTVLAVSADGRTRRVTVGRVKIETRPLLSIDAHTSTGEQVNLIVQDDWHVRILGPGGAVLNSTHLRAGDQILGHLPSAERHVGYPIDELCYEQ
jgi:3-amino-4-hydroxybenzoic acid synthase